ncbi:MAG: arginine--tRNA ligase [Candidatus Aenigmatarchaeota archaeon]
MRNPWNELRELIIDEIKEEFGWTVQLEEPNRTGLGDWALACFDLAKAQGRNPAELAAEIAGKIEILGITTKAIGPYVNFYVDWKVWADKVLASAGPKYGWVRKLRKTAVVDFSSPNPAHSFHMGTVRSTILGDALSRILESQGWSVKRLCYINDLGRQAAVALLGYLTYEKGKRPRGKPDVWLGQLYFRASAAAENSPAMQERIEELLRECEKGTKGYADVSKRLVKWCLSGFQQSWKEMGVRFDKIIFESQFVKHSKELAEALREKGLTFESSGATVLNLESYGMPSTIILRSDGTGLYLIRDLAFALWRDEMMKPERNVYVVAEDQKLHFQQLFKTLELLGYADLARRSTHLAYSMVLLEGKKMSSRAGRIVLWDDLIAEGVKKVCARMTPEAGEPEWKARLKAEWAKLPRAKQLKHARANAMAAIKYFILRYGPEKPVDFHWDAALALEGDTGPYLQYTHARACAILAKAAKVKAGKAEKIPSERMAAPSGAASLYSDEREQALLRLIARYPDVLRRAAEDMRPHYVAGYLFSLADAFNKFYEVLPVLRADSKTRAARLKLVRAVKAVLASGLGMLGITAPERM